jgi:undecaprenyl-diphosphatase
MNDYATAVLLGIVEGLTEFLPVSSTGHLLVVENLLGLNGTDWEAFTVVIQLGAILAVVAVFWRKFWDVLIGLASDPKARQFVINIIIAFLPAAILGVLLIKFINGYLLNPVRAIPVIGASWLIGGIVILIFERVAPRPVWEGTDNLPLTKALQIGFCQCAALVPGTSRSGATILGGELLGVERTTAALFTFYLAVPTMLAATIFELYQKRHELTSSHLTLIAIGFVVSFVVAYPVVTIFIRFISRYGLKPFGWYRVAAGIAALAMTVL